MTHAVERGVREPDHWWPILLDGTLTARYVCPYGHYGLLADHLIDRDGMVTPSVVCPEEGCRFHEMIKLVGWNDEG